MPMAPTLVVTQATRSLVVALSMTLAAASLPSDGVTFPFLWRTMGCEPGPHWAPVNVTLAVTSVPEPWSRRHTMMGTVMAELPISGTPPQFVNLPVRMEVMDAFDRLVSEPVGGAVLTITDSTCSFTRTWAGSAAKDRISWGVGCLFVEAFARIG